MSPISIPGKVTLQKDTIPTIVTDSLVLNLDAGNTSSYPGTGVTWTDLSGNNNNGTLTNGPTYSSANNGYLTFDGTNDYVQVTGSITTSTATFVAWINRNGTQDPYDGLVFSRSSNTTGLHFQSGNQVAYTWNGAPNTYNWSSGLTVPNLSWCMCAVAVDSSSAVAYLCQSSGITSATNSVSHTSTIIDDINIGRDEVTSFGQRYFSGNIAQALIYNRALTAAEITQNYNALKWRYGL